MDKEDNAFIALLPEFSRLRDLVRYVSQLMHDVKQEGKFETWDILQFAAQDLQEVLLRLKFFERTMFAIDRKEAK